MARYPEGPPARGGGRVPGRGRGKGKGKGKGKTPGLGPTPLIDYGPPPSELDQLREVIDSIYKPQRDYLDSLLKQSQDSAAARQRSAQQWYQDVAKFIGGTYPAQIQGIYGAASANQANFAKGFSDGMQSALGQTAGAANAELTRMGAPEGQQIGPGQAEAAGNVVYGLGGAIPANTLNQQGAAFGSLAALQPGFTLQQGAAYIKELAKKAGEDEQGVRAQLAELASQQAGTLAEQTLSLREKQAQNKAASRDEAQDLYNAGLITQREFARRMGLKDWRRYPNTGKPSGSAGIDASASKLVGYLVDDDGNPILDRKGKPIPILAEPEELPRVNTTLSASNGYLTDSYGRPILGPDGNTQPYKPYRDPKSGSNKKGYWTQGPDGWWWVPADGSPPVQGQSTGGGNSADFKKNASEARNLASEALRGRKVGSDPITGKPVYQKFKSWQAAIDWMVSEGADPEFAAWALWSKGGRRLKGSPKKRPSPPKADAAPSGGGKLGYLANLWIQAGGDPAVAYTAAAIAMGESSGNPNARLHTSAEDSRGLWQINTFAHPWAKNLYDPLANAKAAVRVYKNNGNTFNPWTVYKTGAYKKYLAPSSGNVSYNGKGSWGGSQPIAHGIAQLGLNQGLVVSSSKRARKNTASGGVSDHWTGSKNAYAYDISGTVAKMDRAIAAILAEFGVRWNGGSVVQNFYRNGYRIQVLYRTNVGGNHYDHIHIGVRRDSSGNV